MRNLIVKIEIKVFIRYHLIHRKVHYWGVQ